MQPGSSSSFRRLPIGAEIVRERGTHFRVWAPRLECADVVLEKTNPSGESKAISLQKDGGGYFSGFASQAAAGTLYRFRLDGGDSLYSDPASRFQPQGPHGPSQVIDPAAFAWSDGDWPGLSLRGQVMYEMHVGTFTPEGTWAAATRELAELAALGITVIEIMPLADFVGKFGWGYDGVNLFAPTRLYGTPDDFRSFVDRAHALRMGVILDVVYNHLGPDGNHLGNFAADYFTDRYATDWGAAINFDGENSGPVREYFLTNAGYWIDEFHLDGLRLDATQNIYDASSENILRAITRRVRETARGRATIVVAENEPQRAQLVRPTEEGGFGIDALWNDDFHHAAMVALTGHHEAYYTDYRGTPQEFISAVKWGFLYQGQRYKWQERKRGAPALGLPPAAFVTFIQNHDQVANSALGLRGHLLSSPGRYRALTALLLLAPGTPLLFQGQEFAASSPFLYFADHNPELAPLVKNGRAEFLSQFPSIATPEVLARLPDPADPETFRRSKLDFSERSKHLEFYMLHRDLLQLRREDAVFREQRPRGVDGAVLAQEAFVLRFFAEAGDQHDRLLLINLGKDLCLDPMPEPLLAPPNDCFWDVLWSSESPRYGGGGTLPLSAEENWRLPAEAAVVAVPRIAARELLEGEEKRGREEEG